MEFKVGSATDIGRKRSQNQDNLAALPELGLFVVADGMGGHKGGETASAMVVESVPESVRAAQSSKGWDPKVLLTESIQNVNNAIHLRSAQEQGLNGMGTTTTALLFSGRTLTIGHVGDSRCYYLTRDAIWQVTRDHSLVQEKLRAGLITRAEVKTDRMKNVITRSVGFEPNVSVELYEMDVRPGDLFLICSDGLSGMLDDIQIHEIVRKHFFEKRDPQEANQELIAAANSRGGDDNVTSILVEVVSTDG